MHILKELLFCIHWNETMVPLVNLLFNPVLIHGRGSFVPLTALSRASLYATRSMLDRADKTHLLASLLKVACRAELRLSLGEVPTARVKGCSAQVRTLGTPPGVEVTSRSALALTGMACSMMLRLVLSRLSPLAEPAYDRWALSSDT